MTRLHSLDGCAKINWCSVSEIRLPYFGAQRRRIPGATTSQCSFIARRSDAEDGADPPEPPSEMVIVFLRQDTSPHFSPGGAIMAAEFFPQRVLASEERSGFYGRASMCALRGKGQARARPAQSVARRLQSKRRKMLKTSAFRHYAQRPGEKCGLDA